MQKNISLINGIILTVALLWFAVANYRAALPLAEENLRGVALSLAAAVHTTATHDRSLRSLAGLRPHDLAFMAVSDRRGIFRFHSNSDLVGTATNDQRQLSVLKKGEAVENRVTLGTGEKAYEFLTPVHLPDDTLLLHLTLHTYRADAVVRQAKVNLAILLALVVTGWVLSIIIYRYAAREEVHQRELAKRENLARLGEMGAMLAHEIRNPLGGIKGFAQLIEKKPVDERNRGFAERIVNETIRLESLVNDLLAYARTDASVPAPVNVADLVDNTLSLVRSEADRHAIAITEVVPEDLQVYGDRDRLGQVLLNLFNNAIQAMEPDGTLQIEARSSGKAVAITISDTGPGIAEQHLGKVFEPFFTTKAKGTGLGLSLCRKIIEDHGGSMEILSAPGRGTSVLLTLPGGMRK